MGESKLEKPFTVSTLSTRGEAAWQPPLMGRCGDMVAVRPVDPEYGGRTYLGILIGDVALGVSIRHRASDNALLYDMAFHNPAIFVPDLATVIFGIASWWGRIRDRDHLREITDEDIQNAALRVIGLIVSFDTINRRSATNHIGPLRISS